MQFNNLKAGTKCYHPVLGEGKIEKSGKKKDKIGDDVGTDCFYKVNFKDRTIFVDSQEIHKLLP